MTDEQLTRGWLRALAPPPIVAPTAFAESQIILPGSANAIPGPLRLTAYQREPVDAIADDDVEIIVLMLASQVGKSTIINAIMGHCIAGGLRGVAAAVSSGRGSAGRRDVLRRSLSRKVSRA